MAIYLDEGVDVPAVPQQPSNREENETHCDNLLIDDNLQLRSNSGQTWITVHGR